MNRLYKTVAWILLILLAVLAGLIVAVVMLGTAWGREVVYNAPASQRELSTGFRHLEKECFRERLRPRSSACLLPAGTRPRAWAVRLCYEFASVGPPARTILTSYRLSAVRGKRQRSVTDSSASILAAFNTGDVMKDNNTFVCAMCNGVFEKYDDDEWNDNKAKEESKEH